VRGDHWALQLVSQSIGTAPSVHSIGGPLDDVAGSQGNDWLSGGGGRGWRARTELRGGSLAMQGSGTVVAEHVSAREAAELAGLSARTVRRWISEGRLRAEKRGRSFRIAVADLAAGLTGDWAGSHVRTLRRMVFNRPGTVYETPTALLVQLDPFAGQEALVPVVDAFNDKRHRLPWLENRQVVISLTPRGPARSGP